MESVSAEELKTLDQLFDAWDGVSITSDEDYRRLGKMFDEDE